MFSLAKTVTLQTCTFQRFGPGGYGTFIFSQAPTLDLTIADSIVKCYDNPPDYAT